MIHPTTHSASGIQPTAALMLVFAILLLTYEVPLVLAQVSTAITPTIGASDIGTKVMPDSSTVKITGGTRLNNGSNLFHSFDQFSVGRGDTAQFLNTTPSIHTDNILSRVTGGTPSSIFGSIDTTSYPSANFFLMNPAGVVIGPNATLTVGGSVAFTTADYIRLANVDGSNAGIFYANTSLPNLLNSSPVAAFGFLSPNPAAIAIQESTLAVDPGQSISLVGGDHSFAFTHPETGISVSVPNGVTVTGGHLRASDGQIKFASVASQGEILSENMGKAANINAHSFGALGTIVASKHSGIDTSGESGGTILILGGRLVVDHSTLSANTKAITTSTGPQASSPGLGIDIQVTQDVAITNGAIVETNTKTGSQHASGGVRITADHIEISGGTEILSIAKTDPRSTPFAGIRSNVELNSTAPKSGDIALNATAIKIKDLGNVETQTAHSGNAGNITLSTSGNIDMDLAIIDSSSTLKNSSGDSGEILISSSQGDVTLSNTVITSQSSGENSGNAGSLVIKAEQGNILLNGTQVFNVVADGTGTLGGIQFTANNLTLDKVSFIAGNNFGGKVAENTMISLNGLFTLKGNSAITTEALGPIKAADLIVNARDIVITDESSLISGTFSSGAGGTIDLSARTLRLQNGSTLSAATTGTVTSAKGGSIIINATDQVTLTNGGSITASSTGSADAGNISIDAGQQLTVENSKITTEANQSKAGNINIQAIDQVRVINGEISTSVHSGAGKGGDITIDPKTVLLQDGSRVFAQAVQGSGGNITITTPLYLKDATSRVNADSQFGLNGSVTIQSPTSNLSETVGQLASKTNPPQVLLQNRCIALAGGEQSTFILAGRDALPSEPDGWRSSPVAMEHWTGEETEEQVSRVMVRSRGWNTQPVLAMSKDETTVLSLRQLTPPGFLVRSFAVSAATGCSS